jgi:hypothetical protein
MPDQSDFLSDPWGFLADNLVIMGVEAYGGSGIKPFKVVSVSSSDATATKSGTICNVFNLIPDTTRTGSFDAYWCPYEREDTFSVTAGTAADFLFTATITGCSIGLGSETSDGSRLVLHSNLGSTHPKFMSQGEAQDSTLKLMMGASGKTVFGPSSYRNGLNGEKYTGTVVGWRHNGHWEFRTQVYEQLPVLRPQKFQLVEVKRME